MPLYARLVKHLNRRQKIFDMNGIEHIFATLKRHFMIANTGNRLPRRPLLHDEISTARCIFDGHFPARRRRPTVRHDYPSLPSQHDRRAPGRHRRMAADALGQLNPCRRRYPAADVVSPLTTPTMAQPGIRDTARLAVVAPPPPSADTSSFRRYYRLRATFDSYFDNKYVSIDDMILAGKPTIGRQ